MQLERPSLMEMDKNVLARLEKHLTLNMAEESGAANSIKGKESLEHTL